MAETSVTLGALARRAQRRVQPGGAGADDDEIVGGAMAAYGTRVPAPVWLRHDAHLAHDIPGHPERPQRIRALEAEMSAHDWFGCERVEAPAADARAAARRAPGVAHRR